jgi:hypothetical protein
LFSRACRCPAGGRAHVVCRARRQRRQSRHEGSARIEIANNLVYHVFKPMFYNNLVQNRKATCKEHDNFFGSRPDEVKPIAERAGLEAAYRDLLKAPPIP